MIKTARTAVLSLALFVLVAAPALAEGGDDRNDEAIRARAQQEQAERALAYTDLGPGGQVIEFPYKPPPVVTTLQYVPVHVPGQGYVYAPVRVPANVPIMAENEVRAALRRQGFSNIHGWYFENRRVLYRVRAFDNKGQAVTLAVRATDGVIVENLPYWY